MIPPALHVFAGLLFLVRAVVALIVIPKGTGIMVALRIQWAFNGDLMGIMDINGING